MSTEDAMPGSDAANQAKTESMPPSQGHADPDAAPEPVSVEVPSLDSMSVGAADPQAPNHPAAGDAGDRAGSGVPALATGDVPPSELQPEATAHRVPGSVGATGPDEQIETDVEQSAHNTDANASGTSGAAAGPGDAAGVPATSSHAAPGTSQETSVAQGARTPL